MKFDVSSKGGNYFLPILKLPHGAAVGRGYDGDSNNLILNLDANCSKYIMSEEEEITDADKALAVQSGLSGQYQESQQRQCVVEPVLKIKHHFGHGLQGFAPESQAHPAWIPDLKWYVGKAQDFLQRLAKGLFSAKQGTIDTAGKVLYLQIRRSWNEKLFSISVPELGDNDFKDKAPLLFCLCQTEQSEIQNLEIFIMAPE
ncbi:hypothetical protein FQA39_LY18553 [Lamprigera yunnana]|nr:hypothetical protein FQA39_LY18553 [Lamprigera yunnana]